MLPKTKWIKPDDAFGLADTKKTKPWFLMRDSKKVCAVIDSYGSLIYKPEQRSLFIVLFGKENVIAKKKYPIDQMSVAKQAASAMVAELSKPTTDVEKQQIQTRLGWI